MIVEEAVRVGRFRTRTLEAGGSGQPLLLLHGYSDSADTWRPLLRELGKRERRAIAVDLPGFGEASPLERGPILPQMDEFVSELVREQTRRRRQRPLIVGNSLGGVVGLRAAQDPELPLGGLVAISPAGLGHQPWADLAERDPIIHRVLSLPFPVPMRVVRWAVRGAYARLVFADRAGVDREVVAIYASRFRRREDIRSMIRNARALLVELHDAYRLEAVRSPVLLIWGARDPLTPSSGAKRVLDAVHGAELVELQRCGHCAQLECPGRVAELVVDFSDRTSGRRRPKAGAT